MQCALCKNEIENYNSTFNHLSLDEKNSVDLCQDCIDKFMKWQQKKYAKLFPTKLMKKAHGDRDKQY